MIILTIRTDKPEAEIGLFEDGSQRSYLKWQAHRELATTIHDKLRALLQHEGLTWQQLQGIVCYKGPGSFTGLRIGISVANALAQSLQIPVVSENEDNWINNGIGRLLKGDNEQMSLPYYGTQAFTTEPKK